MPQRGRPCSQQIALAFLFPAEEHQDSSSSSAAVQDAATASSCLSSEWSPGPPCRPHSPTSFLSWTYSVRLVQNPQYADLPSFYARSWPQHVRLELGGASHAKDATSLSAHHQELNPVAIGVSSMLFGMLIGAGIVISAASSRNEVQLQPAPAEEISGLEGHVSQTFVPFQGIANRMGEEEAQEETKLTAEQESRSKANATQKAEEDAKMKADEESRRAAEAEAQQQDKAGSADHGYGGWGDSLELASNPKVSTEGKKDTTSKKQKKKNKKKNKDDSAYTAVSSFMQETAAAAAEAGTIAAQAVDGATDQLVSMMETQEEGFVSADDDDDSEDDTKEPSAAATGSSTK